MKTNFWPRSNFPFQPRSKETSRVPSGARGNTKEHNWPRGRERRTLSREIVAELLLLKVHIFLFRIKRVTGLSATSFSRLYPLIVNLSVKKIIYSRKISDITFSYIISQILIINRLYHYVHE